MPSLVERLNKLGLQKASQVKPSNRELKRPLEKILDAKVVENNLGRVLIVEKVYPYGYKHGDIEFVKEIDTGSIHQAGKLNSQTENIKKLVFLDTETTGLSGGTGTIAFLVGLAWFESEGLKLVQLIINDPTEESAMLLELANITEAKEAVVSFNGKSFDMPLLKTRYILNRIPVPFSEWGHLDLLHLSRRLWRNRLDSRTLKDLETEILHIPRTDEEVPGWMIPEIYFNYLRTGDGSKLSNVVYHNAMDIVSLAALYISISNILDRDLFSENTNIEDVYAIGKIYQDIGELNKTRSIFEYCLTNPDLDLIIKNDIQTRLAVLHKKDKDWEKAIHFWQDNGNSGDIDACIEMAKYFEHEVRDVKSALEWTLRAEKNLENSSILRYKKKTIKSSLLVRKKRLEKRIRHV